MMLNENDPFAAAWLRRLIAAGKLPAGEVLETSIADLKAEDCHGTSHFFAGIGGWPLALRLAGWPDDRPVWTGSCPCQPFSVAGRRLGERDARHLWPVWRELIRERRPATIFGEQVAGADGREWFARVRLDLESLGYAVGAADLPAAGVGAPHIRQRLYWVADREGQPKGREKPNDLLPGIGSAWEDGVSSAGGCCSNHRRVRRSPSGLCLVAHGISANVESVRAFGNAIVPQLAAVFIQAFMDCQYAAGKAGTVRVKK